ncbi:hypothetical protein Tco_1359801 [Tanacetum coccineum]
MWIRNLVIRNRVGDLQLGIESYQTKINLERPNWDAADYYFKEDYTIIPKPRAVVYRDRNDQRKLMRLNELHKFSDGTFDKKSSKSLTTHVILKMDMEMKYFPVPKMSQVNNRMPRQTTNTTCYIYERPHKGVKASANSDVMYFFTSAQDGDPSQDDVRLCLGDDLKKAQDHGLRQA